MIMIRMNDDVMVQGILGSKVDEAKEPPPKDAIVAQGLSHMLRHTFDAPNQTFGDGDPPNMYFEWGAYYDFFVDYCFANPLLLLRPPEIII